MHPNSRAARSLVARLAALVVLALAPAALRAQAPASATDSLLPVGAQVRVTTIGGEPVRGRVAGVRDGMLLVRRDGPAAPELTVPLASVTELSVARRPAALMSRNVTTGGVLGLLGAGALYLGICRGDPGACAAGDDVHHHDEDYIEPGAILLVGGALAGGLVGYLLTPKRWEPVELPVRLGVAPTGDGGVRFGASLDASLLGARR